MEEIKFDQLLVADNNEFVSEVLNEIVPIASVIDQDIEINTTVVNRLNVSIENNEIAQEKDAYASADQSELSENQYFSANETKHSSSSSSSVVSNVSSSSSREHSTSSSSRSSIDKNNSVTKQHDSSISNNTLIYDTANTSAAKILLNGEQLSSKIAITDNFITLNLNQLDDDIINELFNQQEEALQDNDDSLNESASTDDSSKTMNMPNMSDIELDTNSSFKSSVNSGLENLKIRTLDIESDDNNASNNDNNDDSKRELVNVELQDDQIIPSEEIKEEAVTPDEELSVVVDKIVSDVITNAVSIAFSQFEPKLEHVQCIAEFEIIATNEEQEVDSAKVHYIYEDDDFSLCQNSDADDQKKQINQQEVQQEIISVESEDLYPVAIDEEVIVTLKRNLENELQIEYNNQSLHEEFIKLNESVKINEPLQEAEVTNVKSNDTLKSTNSNESKKTTKVSKRVSSSDVDCFGCTIL